MYVLRLFQGAASEFAEARLIKQRFMTEKKIYSVYQPRSQKDKRPTLPSHLNCVQPLAIQPAVRRIKDVQGR